MFQLRMAALAAAFVSGAVALAVQAPAVAHEVKVGPLTLTDLWTRATPPGAVTGAGYFTITNTTAEPDRLVSVWSPAAANAEIHEMRMEGDRMLMRPVAGGVEVPAGATVELTPGGYHVMFVGVVVGFEEGGEVPVTLTFEKAGAIDTFLHILPLGSRGPAHDHAAPAVAGGAQ